MRKVNKVTIICKDCGAETQVASTIAHRAKYCKPCALIHKRASSNRRKAELAETKRAARKLKSDQFFEPTADKRTQYRVEFCPMDSWGSDSRLTRQEVIELIDLGYFANGTILEHNTGSRFRIDQGKLVKIGGYKTRNPERDQKIKDDYFGGMTRAELAKKHQLTYIRISQIINTREGSRA